MVRARPAVAYSLAYMDREKLSFWPPPEGDLMDLIETAFIDGQIDGTMTSLAIYWLENNEAIVHLRGQS